MNLENGIDEIISRLEDEALSKAERDSLLQMLDEYRYMKEERDHAADDY